MTNLGLFRNAWQTAYVTNDLDRAMDLMRIDYGTGEFLVMREMPGALADIALAYSGVTMIQLLCPLADGGDIYSDHLADAPQAGGAFVLRHHHFGMLIDTREEMDHIRGRHLDLGNAIALEGESPGAVQYIYADCRKMLGHYLEYIRLEDAGRELFASVPGSPRS